MFPLSKDLNELQSQVASNIANEEQRLVSTKLQQLFIDIVQIDKPEQMWPKLKECVVEMQKLKVGGLVVQPDVLHKVVLNVLTLVDSYVVESPNGEDAFPVVAWFTSLTQQTKVPSYDALASCLQCALELVGAKGGGANLDLTSMQTQRSKLHALEGHMKELQHIIGEEDGLSIAWLKPLKAVKGATEQLIKEKGGLTQKELQTPSIQ